MTHDRDLATTAARTMMRRIAAADPTTAALAPDFWDQLKTPGLRRSHAA